MKKKERVALSKSCDDRLIATRRATMAPQSIVEEAISREEAIIKGPGPKSLTTRLRMIAEYMELCRAWIPQDLIESTDEVAVVSGRLLVLEGWIRDIVKHARIDHTTGVEYVDGWHQ